MRAQARWRAGRRGLDVAAFYRDELARTDVPRVVAACLDALGLVGDETDLATCVAHLEHPSARVRAAAVGSVLGRATPAEALRLLTPLLLDPSARVSTAGSRALVRLAAPPSVAHAAWGSHHPSSRRAAWRVVRAAGGWHRVEADLRAAADPDRRVAALGRDGLTNWLEVAAAYRLEPRAGRAAVADRGPAAGQRARP